MLSHIPFGPMLIVSGMIIIVLFYVFPIALIKQKGTVLQVRLGMALFGLSMFGIVVVFLLAVVNNIHKTALSEQKAALNDIEWRTNFYLVGNEQKFILNTRDLNKDYVDAELSILPDKSNPLSMSVKMRVEYPSWTMGAMDGDTLQIKGAPTGKTPTPRNRGVELIGLGPKHL